MTKSFGIITSCTSRKRMAGEIVRLKPSELQGGPTEIAACWLAAIARALPVMKVGDLYLGRAMSESRTVASKLAASLHVISTGLGFAAREADAPNYDLTVAQGVGSIAPALEKAGYDSADWWRELTALKGTPLPLSSHINEATRTRFLIALPSAYICMLEQDLASLEDSALDRIYIFTSRSGAVMLDSRFWRCVMRYDERLEGHERYAGTRSDFPQRAMRHFVEEIGGQLLGVESANEAVERAMAGLQQPVIPRRARKTDQELIELIRSAWKEHKGSSTRLHRHLRDTEQVACEQSRFRGLWRQVKAEIL